MPISDQLRNQRPQVSNKVARSLQKEFEDYLAAQGANDVSQLSWGPNLLHGVLGGVDAARNMTWEDVKNLPSAMYQGFSDDVSQASNVAGLYDDQILAESGKAGLNLASEVGGIGMAMPAPSGALRMFAAGKGPRGFEPATEEILDLLRKKYPDAEKRGEKYTVSQKKDGDVTNVQVYPEGGKTYVPKPGAPDRYAEKIYDPNLAKVVNDGYSDPGIDFDLSTNRAVPHNPQQMHTLVDGDSSFKSGEKMWRGMSAEEFEEAQKRGYFQSKGDYNLEGQEGETYWSSRPSQAETYASNYAPFDFRATPNRPAYVVEAVQRPENIKQVVGDTELGVAGRVPMEDVLNVYKGSVFDASPSELRMIEDWGNLRIDGHSYEPRLTWELLKSIE